MQAESVEIGSLVLDPANARKHSSKNLEAIKGSLAKFGQQKPIVIGKGDVVIAGNGTLEAARSLGWTEIEVVRTKLEGPEAIAFAIADNRTGELAEWDAGILGETLKSLQAIDFDLGSIGFDADDLAKMMGNPVAEGLTDPDEVPEVVDTRCKPGDLWEMGTHRLLCGDSTNVQHVERLMGDVKSWDLVLTDPPYSVNYDKSQEQRGGNVGVHQSFNETGIDPTDLLSFLALARSDVLVMSYPIDRHFFKLAKALKDNNWEFRKELIWVKDTFSFWMGAKYQQRHEPILLCSRPNGTLGAKHVPANESTVFEIKRPKSHDLHPTAKPIELWEKFVLYHTDPAGTVMDFFGGSGTTIMACEKHGRRGFSMEMSPNYCDVILTRWEKFTGKQATLSTALEAAHESTAPEIVPVSKGKVGKPRGRAKALG